MMAVEGEEIGFRGAEDGGDEEDEEDVDGEEDVGGVEGEEDAGGAEGAGSVEGEAGEEDGFISCSTWEE